MLHTPCKGAGNSAPPLRRSGQQHAPPGAQLPAAGAPGAGPQSKRPKCTDRSPVTTKCLACARGGGKERAAAVNAKRRAHTAPRRAAIAALAHQPRFLHHAGRVATHEHGLVGDEPASSARAAARPPFCRRQRRAGAERVPLAPCHLPALVVVVQRVAVRVPRQRPLVRGHLPVVLAQVLQPPRHLPARHAPAAAAAIGSQRLPVAPRQAPPLTKVPQAHATTTARAP